MINRYVIRLCVIIRCVCVSNIMVYNTVVCIWCWAVFFCPAALVVGKVCLRLAVGHSLAPTLGGLSSAGDSPLGVVIPYLLRQSNIEL